ncbi:MAG TPA: hypothetical protein VGL72_33305 [Bryobacteraceae bacterium]|jgi:hypothetical protein
MGLLDDLMRSQKRLGGPSRSGASVHVTFVTVKFSKSSAQSYGYDDMDTAPDTTDDHVSVKQNGTTKVHCTMHGTTPQDSVKFACDDTSIADVGDLGPSTLGRDSSGPISDFDITINGKDTPKGATVLRARVASTNAELAKININTYKEKPVAATVMKVFDSKSSGTTLRFPNLDVSAVPPLTNPKYKEAVALMSLTDQSSTGAAVDINYDTDNNGKLTWDIATGGGAEWNKITSAFTVAGQKVVIVHAMVSVYRLSAAAAKDATSLTVTASGDNNYLTVGQSYPLGTGSTRENIQIKTRTGSTVTLNSGLSNAHAAGETIEFPAAGWGGNPIVIVENDNSLEILQWTFGHELGHAVLTLSDVDANDSIMNYAQGPADHRLRYKPLPLKYSSGTENQWEKIPR